MNNIISTDIWHYNIAKYLNLYKYVVACVIFKIPINENILRQLLFQHGRKKMKLRSQIKDGYCCFPTCLHMKSFFIWDGDEKETTNISPYCRLHTKKFTYGIKHILYRFPNFINSLN